MYEGYLKSKLQWAVKKTINEKKNYYIQKEKYILILLNVVTASTEALVISGNKFLHACVKEVCRYWAQPRFDTFHQLLIIVETILHKTRDSIAYCLIISKRTAEIQIKVLKLWSAMLTLWTRSSLTTDGWPLHSLSWTFVRPSLNILHHCLTVPSLITLWS
jgi:hypothetical protein